MSDPLIHPFLAGLRPTLHISHRGGAALAPENTLAAFRMAVERYRTDLLELDLQVSRDGVLVVAHDSTVDRCTDGTGEISSFSFAELQRLDAGHHFRALDGTLPFRGTGTTLPRFEEVLQAFPGLRLNVELKPSAPGLEQEFARVVRRAGAVDRVCVGSEEDEIADRLHQALPEACHFYPREALTAFVVGVKSGEGAPVDDRFRVLDMPLYFGDVRLVDEAFLAAARARGKWVNVWTVDTQDEMRLCRAQGVGGVMTDRPDLLRQVLDEAP